MPALSEPEDDDEWDGEEGLITDVVERLEDDLSETEAYMAGPPPMIDAAMPVLTQMGVDEDEHLLRQVHHHRAEEEGEEMEAESGPDFPGKVE